MSDEPEELPCVRAVRERAIAALTPSDWISVVTDVESLYNHRTKPTVLVGIAYPGTACVIAIGRAEWIAAAQTVLELTGCKPFVPKSAMERAKEVAG